MPMFTVALFVIVKAMEASDVTTDDGLLKKIDLYISQNTI